MPDQIISSVIVIIPQKRGEGIVPETSDMIGFSLIGLVIFLLALAFIINKIQ